jgi:hypothetical protein
MQYKVKYQLWVILFFCINGILFYSCNKPPSYPITPNLSFVSLGPNHIRVGQDSLFLKFSFTDGDGDISYNGIVPSGDTNVIITSIYPNSAFQNYSYEFSFPYIEPKGSYSQISGTATINLFKICNCRPDHLLNDTLQFNVKVNDVAKHSSNVINTPPIVLKCN